jgi:hypothetical protein
MASRAKKAFKGIGLLALAGLIFGAVFYGPTLYDFWKAGFFESALNPRELRTYQGNSMQNLAALHKAMMMYHESEGQFPHSAGWMDALKPYIRTDDMKEAEAHKKFVNPLIVPAKEGVFGYAMNDAASEKYKDDVPFPEKTPLLFDSKETGWNAHGAPEKLLPNPPRQGGNMGVSVTGTIVKP